MYEIDQQKHQEASSNMTYQIDRQKFGAFVANLRREKGMTQKELAQRLFLSDKAVSKWETGVSIPDTALFLPLAGLLGVTVTELLVCERMEPDKAMDSGQVENIVKTAISHAGEKPVRVYRTKSKWKTLYVLAAATALTELLVSIAHGYASMGLFLIEVLGITFGGYFCFFAFAALPAYYDEQPISAYIDLLFEMNLPGLSLHNKNWPHVLNAGRVWAVLSMTVYPVFNFLLFYLLPTPLAGIAEIFLVLLVSLAGFFIPIYIVGKKYE